MVKLLKSFLCFVAIVMIPCSHLFAQKEFINCFTVDDQPSYHGKTILLSTSFKADYQGDTKAVFVVSATKNGKVTLWQTFKMERDFSVEYAVPNDVFEDDKLKCYIYNPKRDTILIDSLIYNVDFAEIPSFVPEIQETAYPHFVKIYSHLENFGGLHPLYSNDEKCIVLADCDNRIISKSLSMYLSGYNKGKYFEDQSNTWNISFRISGHETVNVRLLNVTDYAKTEVVIKFLKDNPNVEFNVNTKVNKNLQIERLALVIPFRDDEFIVYDTHLRSKYADSKSKIQNEYYLDHEGVSLQTTDYQLNLYHPKRLSSMQLDAASKTLFLNLDYEKDHPLVHFPLNNDTTDCFVDVSKREVKSGDEINASFVMSLTQHVDLPRIMPIWDGYESGIIFTEHADWTDIRTHRAVCFGSEDVTCADSAVGGFVYYDIPVTKSVFYCNPDSVRNIEKSQEFPDLHSTIKTDSTFFDFLKQLKTNGFDICLHTPEQYTTTPSILSEALSFMKENFGSSSWIDHGYNNSQENNREDIVCDGLNKKMPYYICDLWRQNGVHYPWNAAYEELRPFDNYLFYNHLQRPYPFYSDAFPKPRVIRIPNEPDFLLWSTEYTTEPGDNWNYYFSENRLMKIVESRSVFISHTYPAWVETFRGFWDMENGKVIAKPDFNETLSRIAKLRDEKLMLSTTIDKYMHYQEQLQNVDYQYDNDGNVVLINNNDEMIKGFSLISKSEMKIDGKHYETRISNGEYIIFFDFEPKEEVLIKR